MWLKEQIEQWFGPGYTVAGLQPYLYEIAGRTPPAGRDRIKWPVTSHGVIATAPGESDTDAPSEPIGGAIVTVETAAQMQPKLPSPIVEFSEQVAARNGWLVFNRVIEEWAGNGIGTELTRRRLAWLREDTEAEVAFAVAWERESGYQSRDVLQTCGFEKIGTSNYYFETMEERAVCPDCGITADDDSFCQCAGSIWRKEL